MAQSSNGGLPQGHLVDLPNLGDINLGSTMLIQFISRIAGRTYEVHVDSFISDLENM